MGSPTSVRSRGNGRPTAAAAWRRGLALTVAAFVIGATAALVVTSWLPPTYEAQAVLRIGRAAVPAGLDEAGLEIAERIAPFYRELVTSPAVLSAASDILGPAFPSLTGRVDAFIEDRTRLVVTGRGDDAVESRSIADAVAVALVRAAPRSLGERGRTLEEEENEMAALVAAIAEVGDRISRSAAAGNEIPSVVEATVLRDRLRDLFARYEEVRARWLRRSAASPAIAQGAILPEAPVRPRLGLNLLLGGMLGAVVALPVVLPGVLQPRVSSPRDVRDRGGLNVLGHIPRQRRVRRPASRRGLAGFVPTEEPPADPYRALRWNISIAMAGRAWTGLLVIGADRVEGRDVVAANLAIVLAREGRRVLLVDGDVRSPSLHRSFGVEPDPGLSDALRDRSIPLSSVIRPTRIPGLRLAVAGDASPDRDAYREAARWGAILRDLGSGSDVLIVCGPALAGRDDLTVMSSHLDGTLIVVDAGVTTPDALARAQGFSLRARSSVLGAALIRLPRSAYPAIDPRHPRPRAPAPGQVRWAGPEA